METLTEEQKKAQGAELQTLTLENVQQMLERDLKACASLMNAILADKETVNQLADFLHGRYLNAKHKEELENQIL